MSAKKNARPDVGASERAKETGAASRQATTSAFKFTTFPPPGQGVLISDLLSHGADHGVHLSDLVKLTDLPERTVRQMIHQERRRHIPILSNNKDGYYLPGSDYEKADCVRSLRRRAMEIMEAADGIEAAGKMVD